jgi:outer membrane lipoprotein-sorting protein
LKKLASLLALTFVLAAAALAQPAAPAQPAADLPTVDQVLAKAIEATGGKAAEEKITSRVAKGTIEVVTFGVSGPVEIYAKAPNKMFTRSTFEGYGEVVQGYDGKSAWMKTPDAGIRELSGVELERVKRGADFYRALHLKDQYAKMTVTGKGKVGDREAFIVEAKPTEGAAEKFYYDTQTGLLLRNETTDDSGGQTTTTVEDYKVVDGLKLAHTIRQESAAFSMVIKLTDVKHGAEIDDAKFAKPAN